MTTNEKLKKLKKAIISAVPDIVELKFGCKIISKKYREYGLVSIIYNYNVATNKIETNNIGAIKPKDIFKILGRPITIEDILSVLKHKNIAIESNEYFILNGNRIKIEWKFNKPLDQQPKETIDFLYNLIYEKNNHPEDN